MCQFGAIEQMKLEKSIRSKNQVGGLQHRELRCTFSQIRQSNGASQRLSVVIVCQLVMPKKPAISKRVGSETEDRALWFVLRPDAT